MKWLVTAGNTVSFIDKVRCITNVFSGRTGAAIALRAAARGHSVVLLTSNPEAVGHVQSHQEHAPPIQIERFRTFEDLASLLSDHVANGRHDAVVHCAAVSDYEPAGVFAPGPGTRFDASTGAWSHAALETPTLLDRQAGKVKSNEPELWLRLIQTPKLIDQIREPWGFRGVLVKFKLEVGVGEERLLEIAEPSRKHSDADLMVMNTLEEMNEWALLGPIEGVYQRIDRGSLAERLVQEVERLAGSPPSNPSTE